MFNLVITKSQLLTPLLLVAGAVDKKQSLAILANILLILHEGELRLTATDLEIEITARINCSSSMSNGSMTIPAKKFMDIIRSLDDTAEPTLQFNANSLLIRAGRSQFKLATLPADDFPANDNEHSDIELSLPRLDLIHLLQSTHFALAQQDVRMFLNGLYLEFDEQSITAVAMDGHRMAICKLPFQTNTPLYKLLLPRKGVLELLKLLTTIPDETVSISAGKGHFKMDSAEYTFLSKLIETRFPPYGKVIPKNQDKFVLIDRDQLKRALNRIIILANEKSRAVMLHMQPSMLTLIANNQEQEEAMESLEATTEGEELKIGINAGYLLDVFNIVEEGLVRLSMSTKDNSILVESLADEHYQYIIMPMKL